AESGFSNTTLHSPCISALASATFVPSLCTLTFQPGAARPAITPSPFGSMTTTSKVGTEVGSEGSVGAPVALACGFGAGVSGAVAGGSGFGRGGGRGAPAGAP